MPMQPMTTSPSPWTRALKRALGGLTLTVLGFTGAVHAQNQPFGSHRQTYHASTLSVSAGTAAADNATADFYWKWKSRYVKPACHAGDYRIQASTDGGAYVVSEGQGFGMLVTVMMAGKDPEARTLFDGLHRYNRRHPSAGNPDLTAWAQDIHCNDVLENSSATDGDLDIAYALLLAHKQWGSAGAINYSAEATRVLTAIAQSNINPVTRLTNLGDWARWPSDPNFYYATRSSDWMLGHFRGFIGRAGTDWAQVLNAHQTLLETMQSRYASSTGLLPDFITNTHTGTPTPAAAYFLESPNDGSYSWNACRVPWRLGIDAAISGDSRTRNSVGLLSRWIRSKTGSNPNNIRAGYYLNGNQIESYTDMAFIAPFAVAATADSGGQAWLDSLWARIVSAPPEDYYGDTIKMLSMLSVSRNWMTP
ncbi:MAG: glycosyl hydrolase family 8 [Cystobacter sp.]